MTRLEQIEEAAKNVDFQPDANQIVSFIVGAQWADANPDIDIRLNSAFISSTMIGARDHIILGLEQQLAIAKEALKLIPSLLNDAEDSRIAKEALAKIEKLEKKIG
jgi:hypothetical protein